MTVEAKQLNSLALAYMGDAIYEVHVREYLIKQGQVKPNSLHQAAVRFVSADNQANIVHYWLKTHFLTEIEIDVIKRGRNAKSGSTPKNMSISDYRYATAFEALIGFHYLEKNNNRLNQILNSAVEYIAKKQEV